METILPMKTDPLIQTYPYFSNYLGVLEANGYDVSGVLFNHFLTLYYTPWSGKIGMRQFKYLKTLFQVQPFTLPLENPIETIMQAIDQGKYVSIVLDEICLNRNNQTVPTNSYHDCMIYGYSQEQGVFKAISYIEKIYTPYDLSFSCFLKALPNGVKRTGYENNMINNHYFWIKDDFQCEKMDIARVVKELSKYLYGIPPMFFNSKIYKKYCLYLRIKNIVFENHYIDLKNFRAIYEQKFIMYHLALKVSKQQDIIDGFSDLLLRSRKAMMLAVKYYVSYDKKNIKKIIKILSCMRALEKPLIQALLKETMKEMVRARRAVP